MSEPYPLPATKRPPLRRWEKPNDMHDYSMGVDTGEGLGQEFSVAAVFDRHTGAQVAQYITNQQDPEEFASSAMALGKYYNNALAVIERNGVGLSVVVLFKQSYPRHRIWKQKILTKSKHTERTEYGWLTTKSNRSHMIFDLKAGVKVGNIKIRSQISLDQMKVFVRKAEGRIEHAEGECDDCVFADALSYQGFKDITPKRREEMQKLAGPTTIGEFVDVSKQIMGLGKRREFRIGVDDEESDLSIVIRD